MRNTTTSEARTAPVCTTTEYRVGGTTVVALRGELDLLTAGPVAAQLTRLAAEPRPDLAVDLRELDFLDCSGISVLCRVRHRVLAHDGRMTLVVTRPYTLRMLRALGLLSVFDVRDTVPAGPVRACRTTVPPPETALPPAPPTAAR